jgi:peptide/nickel transport system ATP-binding protein
MSALLEISELSKTFTIRGSDGGYEQLTAVDRVSFSIDQGGAMAVVGESGSGKTTVARIVAGLDSASSGRVMIDAQARSPKDRRNARKRFARLVQMVFQDPYSSLDPRQTISRAIDEVLREHFDLDVTERRARTQELLDQVGLDTRQAGARPDALSGGQRQRAAIARALAVQPRLLILDEAVSALDVSVQAQIINLLIDLRRSLEVAFLLISHDLAVVRQICDECVVMQGGRIIERGTVSDILDIPANEYTKHLINSIPRPGWRPRRRSPGERRERLLDPSRSLMG